jgi:flagellar hook-associated protein 1 FlgK
VSLSLTLGTALSGLSTAQRALGVTAHNVANANTEGYVRKVFSQEARVVDGRGVGTRELEPLRAIDRFLTVELRDKAASVGRSEVLDRYHGHLQGLFGTPAQDHNLAAGLGRLSAAIEAFANEPESSTFAQGLIAAAQDLTRDIGRFAGDVERLRAEADRELAREVQAVNADVRALHELNGEIARRTALGGDTTELQDRRDGLLLALGGRLDITTYELDEGAIAVATKSGVVLLDSQPRVLTYAAAGTVTDSTSFGRIAAFRPDEIDPATGQPYDPGRGIELVSGGVRAELTPELLADATPDADQTITSGVRGGRIKGLLEVRDRVLPELNDQIQELAAGLRFALNAAHNAGAPHPPPATLTGTRTDLAGFPGNGGGAATLAVVDADGAVVTAFAVDMTAADPAALATAITADLGGLGTAAITADGRLEIALADPSQGLAVDEGTSAVAVTDDAGRTRTYGFSHYFGLNDLLVLNGPRASQLGVRADIAADPARLSTARLDVLDAGPPPTAALGGPGDGRAVQALAAAMTEKQSFIARGGLPARDATLATYAGDVIAIAAIEARRAADGLERDRAMADNLSFRAAAISGVNLDEELSRLVVYQQSYAVAARVISIVDELFDELLGTAR